MIYVEIAVPESCGLIDFPERTRKRSRPSDPKQVLFKQIPVDVAPR